jgi:hypothetical protein
MKSLNQVGLLALTIATTSVVSNVDKCEWPQIYGH